MAGGYYIALSGMRARLEALDRLASDIANASTAGYKAERATTAQADRAGFDSSLQSAIDVAQGPTRLDFRAGAIAPTGRSLDVAIDGPGLFAVRTSAGTAYTRDGHLQRRPDGVLAASTGDALENEAAGGTGPITVGAGPIVVDADGTVHSGDAVAGRLRLVEFDHPEALARQGADLFRSDGQPPRPAVRSAVRTGALEQSNVSVVDRIAEISTVSRNFETMQRAISTLSNEVDLRAITELGRRG